MSAFKGTPGPWVILDRNAHGDLWVGPENDPGIRSNGVGIVMIRDFPFGLTPEQVAANAHLIAAAPLLLEALVGMLVSDNDTARESDSRWAVFRQNAHKAIAAALGEVQS